MTNLKNLIFLSGLLAVIHVSLGQLLKDGPCPNVIADENFQIEHYDGKWYDYAKYPNNYVGSNRCIVYGHKVSGDEVLLETWEIDSMTDESNYKNGTAKLVEPGKFEVKFENEPFFGGSDYMVLYIDENSYAILYSCNTISFSNSELHLQWLWVMTRERNPEDSVIEEAKKTIEDQGLSLEELQKTDQNDCPED